MEEKEKKYNVDGIIMSEKEFLELKKSLSSQRTTLQFVENETSGISKYTKKKILFG